MIKPFDLNNHLDIFFSLKSATELLKIGNEILECYDSLPEEDLKPNSYSKTIADSEKIEKVRKRIKVIDEAISLLKNPDLLNIIDEQMDKYIVGENQSRKAIFINGCGIWVENAKITSFNLCLNSNSGAGKDYVCRNVLKIFPKDYVMIRSRITPTAFTYWHNSSKEPDWTWDGKILLLSDISNEILNSDVFKVMTSDGSNSTIVKDQTAIDITIQGKPVFFITTASANPNNEMLRRFPFLELDENPSQTRKIRDAQAKAAMNGTQEDYDFKITYALSYLKRVKVKIPFADKLIIVFPDSHMIMRTHFSRLLDLIKASASLHQYQRETDSDGFIIAQPEDYDNAIICMKSTTSNSLMIPLSKKQKLLLEFCKTLDDFTVSEIEPKVPFLSQSKLYPALAKLQEHGFLESYILEEEGKKKPVRHYRYVFSKIPEIPTWQEINSLNSLNSTQNISQNNSNNVETTELKNTGNQEIKGIDDLKTTYENIG